ncbi:rCG21939, partial [Rattus norvegicus]
MLPHISACS